MYQREDPLRNSQQVNKLHLPTSSYLKSFKKSNIGNRENRNPYQDALPRKSNECKQVPSQNNKPIMNKAIHKYEGNNKGNKYLKDKQNPIQFFMQETDNSMEEMLNSSINQLQKLIIRDEEEGQSLEDQNYRLKSALGKMKNILKGKLESALQKQKEELSKMLEDYISLITKLLQDKEELTISIQDIQQSHEKQLKEKQELWNGKFNEILEERDEYINSTKTQIDEFLQVIEHYEEESKVEQQKFSQLQNKITELEEEKQFLLNKIHKSSTQYLTEDQSIRVEAQATKIQTLLQLLEKSEEENNTLKQQMTELRMRKNVQGKGDKVKQEYQRRLQQLQEEHEEQFLEYERAIKDTLSKKDQCIERLNMIIEGLRERKAN